MKSKHLSGSASKIDFRFNKDVTPNCKMNMASPTFADAIVGLY